MVDSALLVIGKIYYNMFEIQEKIKNFPGITSAQRHELYQSFVNRWTMLHTDLHSADPEYVSMAQNTNEEAMNAFYHLVENLYPDTEDQATITTQLTQFRSSHGIFGSPVAKTAASTMPAYQRWLNFGASVPELQEFAGRILSQTASSSEAEPNWSLFGFVQNDRRCSLKSETLERMVFIHANTKLIDKVTDVCYELRTKH